MSEHIKTTREIRESIPSFTFEELSTIPKIEENLVSLLNEKWVSVEWLKEQIVEKRKEYPTTSSSEWIENGSVKEFVDWLLHTLEG